jgi:Ca2+-binding RTX toxin-like protein
MTSYTYGGSTSGLVNPIGRSYNIVNGTDNPETILGTANDDYICGMGGSDVLTGGDGFDLLEGGNGGDIFTFQVNRGYDTVKDFGKAGFDRISFTSALGANGGITAANSSQITSVIQDGGTAIIYNGNVWMFLQGYTTAMTASNFIFSP